MPMINLKVVEASRIDRRHKATASPAFATLVSKHLLPLLKCDAISGTVIINPDASLTRPAQAINPGFRITRHKVFNSLNLVTARTVLEPMLQEYIAYLASKLWSNLNWARVARLPPAVVMYLTVSPGMALPGASIRMATHLHARKLSHGGMREGRLRCSHGTRSSDLTGAVPLTSPLSFRTASF